MKLSGDEKPIFHEAFRKSTKSTIEEREQDGFMAVEKHRVSLKKPKEPSKIALVTKKLKDRPKTIMEAVDQGIEDGSQ